MKRTVISALLAASVLWSACSGSPAQQQPPQAATATVRSLVPLTLSTPRVLSVAGASAPNAPKSLPPDHAESAATATRPDPAKLISRMPQVGSPAPDFTLKTLDGAAITLSQLRGHPVLINFWASWCVACRAEAPDLERLYSKYRGHGLVVLGVNITQQDTLADARQFVASYKLTFPIPLDDQGSVMAAYRVPGLPTSYFIDRSGVIRDFIIGQMNWATMLEGESLADP